MMTVGSENRVYIGKIARPEIVELLNCWFVAKGDAASFVSQKSETIGTVPLVAACPKYHSSDAF